MEINQTVPCPDCRYSIAAAKSGLAVFRSARGGNPRLFLLRRDNSVRETNAQPAPGLELFKGFGVLPQQAETVVLGVAGNRSFESLWE